MAYRLCYKQYISWGILEAVTDYIVFKTFVLYYTTKFKKCK